MKERGGAFQGRVAGSNARRGRQNAREGGFDPSKGAFDEAEGAIRDPPLTAPATTADHPLMGKRSVTLSLLLTALAVTAGCGPLTTSARPAATDLGEVDDEGSPDGAAPIDATFDAAPDVRSCPVGQRRCDAVCVDTRNDPMNCGGCSTVCPQFPHASTSCTGGVCAIACAAGWGDCDAVVTNGCETDLAATTGHCGRCSNACGAPPNATAACRAAACVITCAPGFTGCGATCVDPQQDPSHCGACGRSCAAGMTCSMGVCGVSPQRSCSGSAAPPGCGLVPITGGTFTMGSDDNCEGPSGTMQCVYAASPAQPNVTVSNFAIDAYEVTVARFNAYWAVRARDMAEVRARPIRYRGGTIEWNPTMPPEPCRQTDSPSCNWLPTSSARDAHPVRVPYWLAQEFCVWDGGRLPTEAEWEYVARGTVGPGRTAGRLYPWGDEDPSATCDRARWNDTGCAGDDGGHTRRVGSFPSGASGGIYDLAGNEWEWLADVYVRYWYASAPDSCPVRRNTRDPLCVGGGTLSSEIRAVRGWDWRRGLASFLRAANRFSNETHHGAGFRCARDLP